MFYRYLILTTIFLSVLAHAGSTTELSVTGRITPSACEPTLSAAGQYDLGKISARDLNVDQPTRLTAHELQLKVTCEAMTLLALETRDNRSGSSYSDRLYTFGLGLINDAIKLGYMTLELNSITAQGTPMYALGSTWAGWGPTSILSPEFLTAFTPNKSMAVPAPVQLLNANVQIVPTIAPANTLPLTEEVPIDGFVTLTVKYL